MNRWIPSFKRFFVEAVYHDKAAINRSGLRDFLNDELPDDLGQFAARVLMHFCVDDSRFNGNMTAVKAVLAFLEEGSGSARTRQAMEGLRDVLFAVPVQEAVLRRWADSWFG